MSAQVPQLSSCRTLSPLVSYRPIENIGYGDAIITDALVGFGATVMLLSLFVTMACVPLPEVSGWYSKMAMSEVSQTRVSWRMLLVSPSSHRQKEQLSAGRASMVTSEFCSKRPFPRTCPQALLFA